MTTENNGPDTYGADAEATGGVPSDVPVTEKDILTLRLEAVKAGFDKGWVFTPLGQRSKKPRLNDWTNLPAPTWDEVEAWAKEGNVGLRTGAVSGVFVVDDDIEGGWDPETPLPVTVEAITGSGARHYLFKVPEQDFGNSAGKLAKKVDTRGKGGQIVYPGSVHPSGGTYRWAPGRGPDEVELAELPDWIVSQLSAPKGGGGTGQLFVVGGGDAAQKVVEGCTFVQHCRDDSQSLPELHWHVLAANLAALGEDARGKFHELSKGHPGYSEKEANAKFDAQLAEPKPHKCSTIRDDIWDCGRDCGVASPCALAYRPRMGRHSPHGHDRLMQAIADADWTLKGDALLAVLEPILRGISRQKALVQSELLGVLKKASKMPLGTLRSALKEEVEADAEGSEMGARAGDEIVISSSNPRATARTFLAESYSSESGDSLLRYHRGDHRIYDGVSYQKKAVDEIEAEIDGFVESCVEIDKDGETYPAVPTPSKTKAILKMVEGLTIVSADRDLPTWLANGEHTAKDVLPMRNGLLHMPTRELLPPSWAFFTSYGLSYDYVSDAASPVQWLEFCDDAFQGCQKTIDCLQEVFGYLVSGDTSLQKIPLLIGPPRSGKGTIGRVITQLIGPENTCNPTLAQLGTPFGKQTLISKSLAIISDARISSRSDKAAVIETLLSVSGEDSQQVPRKFQDDWNGPLLTRFFCMSNEYPNMVDNSAALAHRFEPMETKKSNLGNEDLTLTSRLLKEKAGILNWALDGRDRLLKNGKFTVSDTSARVIEDLVDMGSPITRFIEDWGVLGDEESVSQVDLYHAYSTWSKGQGEAYTPSAAIFTRNLRSAFPDTGVSRVRSKDGRRERVYTGLSLRHGWRVELQSIAEGPSFFNNVPLT